MAAAAGGEIRAGIGPRLRVAREKKGLTILQAAEKMHVDSRILESLEAEDFAALGAPVYARGHLRHYAELVDESPAELQALYAEATKSQPAQPDLTRIARGEPQDDSRRLAAPALIGMIAVAVIGSVWWVINLSGDKVQPAPPRSTAASSSVAAPSAAGDDTNTPGQAGTEADNQNQVAQPAPADARRSAPGSKSASPRGSAAAGLASAAPGGTRPSASGSAPAARSGAPGGITPSSTTPGGPRNTSANAAVASATPANAVSSTRVAAATPVTNTPATAPNPGSRAKDGELTLRFSSDSWAEVYDASGQRLFYDVGAAASAHTVKGPAPLRVVLGNAAGVAVEYNGRPALVPASNQPDGSARFMINARGRAVATSAPASNGD
jgi:cytoskeleton protein RodZ